jgi:hypothetical protein
MVVRLLVTPAKATATQAVEVAAMPTGTGVTRESRRQKIPVAAAMREAAVAAMPTTTTTRLEEDAGEVVRTGNPAPPSSRK